MSAVAAVSPVPPRGVAFARQPVLDRNSALVGYELIYSDGDGDRPAQATARIAAAALTDIGLHEAAAGERAFLNVTAEMLLAIDPIPFSPDAVVLELDCETLNPGSDLLERLERLDDRGYEIALDGYRGQPALEPLLRRARYAKIDASAVDPEALSALVSWLSTRRIAAIAHRVDTHELHERCRDAGFALFQGAFISQPREITARGVPAASIGAVRLAATVASTGTDVAALEEAIELDPGLSLRLLRFINSAAFSLRHDVRSVRQAIALLGPRTVRQWASLIVLSRIEAQRSSLLTTALSRGRTCELIAERLGAADDVPAYFFAGLMSVVDAMLDLPMDQAIADLPLAPDVAAALTGRAGGKGRTITMAEACENGLWASVALPTLPPEELADIHAEALAWADSAIAGLAD